MSKLSLSFPMATTSWSWKSLPAVDRELLWVPVPSSPGLFKVLTFPSWSLWVWDCCLWDHKLSFNTSNLILNHVNILYKISDSIISSPWPLPSSKSDCLSSYFSYWNTLLSKLPASIPILLLPPPHQPLNYKTMYCFTWWSLF